LFQNMTLGQYYPGSSALHRLDPRMKIGLTTLYIAGIFMLRGWMAYAVVTAFVIAIAAVSGVPPKVLLRGLKPIMYLVIFTFILNLFSSTGETVLFHWWIIRVTAEGMMQAFQLMARLVFLVLGTSLLTLTTSPIALTDGLERVLSPLKVIRFPAHELAMMMTIALRFIPTLMGEADRIMKAQMARGADFESGNLLKRARAMVPLLVPLFVSAFRRADELGLAMEARCYHGGEGRTRMRQLRCTTRDYLALCITAAWLALLIVLR